MIQHFTIPKPFLEGLKVRVVVFWWKTSNAILNFIQTLLFKPVESPKKVLVFRNGSLGDGVCAIPAILAIRKSLPNTKLDILSNTGRANLISLSNLLPRASYDEFIDYQGIPQSQVARILQNKEYDAVIVLTQNQAPFRRHIRDMLFFRFFAKIKSGFGWELATIHFFKQAQEMHVRYFQESERLLQMLKSNSIEQNTFLNYEFEITPQDQRLVERHLIEIQKGQPMPLLSVVPGAKRPQNRWPAEYFQTVIQALRHSYKIILIGGVDDTDLANSLATGEGIFNLCGQLSPIQSGLLISKSALCISNDTGPMHLAYSFNTPLIALFSSRDFPYKWFPPDSPKTIVLRTNSISCSLCLSEDCDNNICMQEITPETVLESVQIIEHHLAQTPHPN